MKMSRLRAMPVLARALVLVMALVLAGCGTSDKEEPTATSAPAGGTTATEPAEQVSTPAGTVESEPTEEASPAATAATPEATEAVVPATSAATPEPAAATPVASPEAPATPVLANATAVAGAVEQGTPPASPAVTGGMVVSNLGCWSEPPSSSAGYPQWSNPPEMRIDPAKHYTATILTNRGTIVADLYADKAPNTVNNFICLATEGYYNGVVFHRVIDGFMIQTGDPTGTGRGGPGYQFADELPGDDLDYNRGVLAMANAGPNTNGSQLFINQGDNSGRLSKDYTIFGTVTEGMDVVDHIAGIPVSANAQGEDSVPAATVTILSITIEEQ